MEINSLISAILWPITLSAIFWISASGTVSIPRAFNALVIPSIRSSRSGSLTRILYSNKWSSSGGKSELSSLTVEWAQSNVPTNNTGSPLDLIFFIPLTMAFTAPMPMVSSSCPSCSIKITAGASRMARSNKSFKNLQAPSGVRSAMRDIVVISRVEPVSVASALPKDTLPASE